MGKQMKKEVLIFDLDGTILDTLEDLYISTNYALTYHGFPERSKEEVRLFVGNGIAKLIQRAVPEHTSEETTAQVLETFKKHYGEHCADHTSPYEGILPLLEELKKQGYETAVVSNKADFAVQELCRQYFPGAFAYVVGEREGIRRKPAPDSVLEVLKTLKHSAAEAVYIGDSDVDLQTAANAHMEVIGVSWGFRGRDFLQAHGAAVIADTPEEILTLVKDI
jgi:phosphoglycolate phosphatase